ncbi:MAG TPA: HD domain-containing protein [Chthoniobacteraceae bacterium]|nr:HD domain-containing protein [Chthoniobacteraceae bacterium]
MDLLTISDLKRAAQNGRAEGRVHAQVETIVRKETRDLKPFWELTLADALAKMTLRAWSDSPNYPICAELANGAFLEIAGEFTFSTNYGLDSKKWTLRALDDAERDALLAGTPALRDRQAADFEFIAQSVAGIADPRLRALGEAFLRDFGDKFRRAAAARNNHHARRGGLVEHTAQMMRAAEAICGVYTKLNRDLMLAGVLFHDCGKLWENGMPEAGFAMEADARGELLGHIAIGVELVNTIWRKLLATEEAKAWATLQPPSDDVRMHLLHLIVAHHGELQFGSPAVPKTPEAQALHYIDNLDAKMEMFAAGYEKAAQVAPGIYEKTWPLPGNLIAPLPPFSQPSGQQSE